ncbi:DUF3592 domain-containing protein [Streptomyces sp. NPDC050085]|uniref:DUF3592 domain-containing protein n=1 Tax=Streptomyces sp. NPDC050085 TaxID=3365600 RepID=UPI00379FDCFD
MAVFVVVLIVWGVFYAACGAGVVLGLVPRSRRERRLRRHGQSIDAVCRGHLQPVDAGRPPRLRCAFRPPSISTGEYEVVVESGAHLPQVGDAVRIVYDPEDLQVAVLAERVTSAAFGRRDLIALAMVTVLYAALGGCLAAISG